MNREDHGFVNRRPGVQSPEPAPSENHETRLAKRLARVIRQVTAEYAQAYRRAVRGVA